MCEMAFLYADGSPVKFPWGKQKVLGHFKCPVCGRPIYVCEFADGEEEHYYYLYHFNPEEPVDYLCPIAQDADSSCLNVLGGVVYDSLDSIVDAWAYGIKALECTE